MVENNYINYTMEDLEQADTNATKMDYDESTKLLGLLK